VKDQSESIKELIKIEENALNPPTDPNNLRILRENLTTGITTTTITITTETKSLIRETTSNQMRLMPRDSNLSQDLPRLLICNLALLDKLSSAR